jgi:hypothetical protein
MTFVRKLTSPPPPPPEVQISFFFLRILAHRHTCLTCASRHVLTELRLSESAVDCHPPFRC